MMNTSRITIGWSLCLTALGPLVAIAEEKTRAQPPAAGDRSARVAAGSQYEAGALWALFFGRDYRDLWTTPVEVPVLDLETFAGGLTPTKETGGRQTRALNFKGGNGREYKFRSIDKDPSEALPEEMRGGQIEGIARDQTSSGHPAAPLIAEPLLRAAGLLHVRWRMVVLPDSPRLGEFQKEFAGMLGTIEDKPDDKEPEETPGFERITRIVETEELYKTLRKSGSERVDARAYLRARLVDLFVGDWDRHYGQWDWGKSERDGLWKPIPKDRDQAFSRYDGLLVGPARKKAFIGTFEERYGDPMSSNWVAREMDRRFFAGLDEATWIAEAQDLSKRFTDAVIDDAVKHEPSEYYERRGGWLSRILKARRDRLVEAAGAWYRTHAQRVDVFASDDAERLEATHTGDGLEVRLVLRDQPDPPTLVRRFARDETDEVRVYLQGGSDEAVVRGTGPITLRVVGGAGNDLLDDAAGGGTRFYDAEGENAVRPGRSTHVSTRPYDEPEPPKDERPRDWGHRWSTPLWLSAGSDIGLFVGAGIQREGYGFRKEPFSTRQTVRVGYATDARRARADYVGEFHRAQSSTRFQVLARMSGIDVVRFYGIGNDTSAGIESLEGDEFFKTHQSLLTFAPALDHSLAPSLRLRVGPKVRYSWTREQDRFLDRVRPYGSGKFGEAGAQANVDWDLRDDIHAPRRGARVFAGGTLYPGVWDVDRTFGEVHGEAAGALTARPLLESTLAARVGGKKVFGRFPYFESAFIGGSRQEMTVRGLHAQRYAGDASLYGNVELRVRLGRVPLLVPNDVGIYGLVDAGRVYADGRSPGGWHTGVGGGIWIAPLKRRNSLVLTLTMAQSEGRLGTYFRAGFPF
jgi:hypothetical protein